MSKHHAPRGPVKSKPIEGITRGTRCSAKSSRTGLPCRRYPIAGGNVCMMHGGAAPQVRKAAEKRLEELRQPAVSYLAHLLEQKEFPSAGLGAAKDVLDRLDGKPRESVALEHSGDVVIRWSDE
jgi:hypothetical protein